VRNVESAGVLALLEQFPAAPAVVLLSVLDGQVQFSEAARDLGMPCEEVLPGGPSLLEPSDLGTEPPPLGFEARGVRPSTVFPSDECFVEAVARGYERSSGLVAGPPT
jgi:hypothetical protein